MEKDILNLSVRQGIIFEKSSYIELNQENDQKYNNDFLCKKNHLLQQNYCSTNYVKWIDIYCDNKSL